MSRLMTVFGLCVALGCGGGERERKAAPGEPQTAREKQYAEAAKAGEIDSANPKWGKWRYTGDRKDCFFVAGRKCFKTAAAACQAARCKAPAKCATVGAGPATVRCE
jgi:hypothetical protein